MIGDSLCDFSRAMRFYSTNNEIEKLGAKVESMTIPALSQTIGRVFEYSPTTENLRFEVKCISISSKQKESKLNLQEKSEKTIATSHHISTTEYNDCDYKAKLELNYPQSNGNISIWVNKQNTLFNILSLIVKFKDRIQKDWTIHACSVSTLEANLPWITEFIQKRPLSSAENKYEESALLALLFSINTMNDDEYSRWFYRLIFSIWFFSSICLNHISDELAMVALAESRDIIGINFIFKNTFHEKKNLFDLINECDGKQTRNNKPIKKATNTFDERNAFALEGWKISDP